MEGLKESSGFIRSKIAHTINLRITPELVFELDDSLEYGEKIDAILKELKNAQTFRRVQKSNFDTFSLAVNKYVILVELSFTRYDTI